MPQFWIQTDRQHSRKISKDKLLSLSKLARAFWEKHPSQMRRASSGQYGRGPHPRSHTSPRPAIRLAKRSSNLSVERLLTKFVEKSNCKLVREPVAILAERFDSVFLVIRPISAKKGCRPARTFDSSQTLLRNATRVICLRYAREFQYQP